MRQMFHTMYFRPETMWKDFIVKAFKETNNFGYKTEKFVETDVKFRAVLAQADAARTDRMKHLFDQDQHSITHTLTVCKKENVKKGDYVATGDRVFLVLVVDDIGDYGTAGLIYVEERNDIK